MALYPMQVTVVGKPESLIIARKMTLPLATAWVIAKGTLPIIGVTKVHHVEDAAKAAKIVLSAPIFHIQQKGRSEYYEKTNSRQRGLGAVCT